MEISKKNLEAVLSESEDDYVSKKREGWGNLISSRQFETNSSFLLPEWC